MDLKTLKKNRSSYKAKLTIFKSYLQPLLLYKELNNLQQCELSSRLNKIQDMYNDFDNTQTEIENLSEISDGEYTERETFENTYFGLVAAAQNMLSRGQEPAGAHGNQVTGSSSVSGLAGGTNIKLPIINLPTFSGRYQDWLEYHDTFSSLIHKNTTIPTITKFHYLRASLKEGALLVIQSLDFSEDNYDIAWSLLCDRYNNDRLLVNKHIKALFNIEPIQRETSSSLRNVIDTVNKNLRALKNVKLPTEHWDTLIIELVLSKLDPISSREWEQERNHIKELPSLDNFNLFLKNRADLLETIEEKHKPRRHSDITHVRPRTFIANQSFTKQSIPTRSECPICKHPHPIYSCFKFKSLPIEQRIEKVKQLHLCTNCLRKGHEEQQCKLGPCKICSQKHNTMLHIDSNTTEPKSNSSRDCVVLPTLHDDAQSSSIQNNVTLSSIHQGQVLLSTTMINILDHKGQLHSVRALLDNGSTSSFITQSLQIQLGIPSYSTTISVQGLNGQFSQIKQRCDISLSSLTNSGYSADVNCLIVPHITQVIPSTRINCKPFKIPANLQLADPTFNVPSEVQLLLGADLFWEVLTNNTMSLGKGNPTLVETRLGWLVTGSFHVPHTQQQTYNNTVHSHFTQTTDLDEKLNKFFELESIPAAQQVHTKGESECERIFTQTTVRQQDGRFVVHIPLKESPNTLGDSEQQALTRFYSLERKFNRNHTFKTLYTDFMNEYIALGHMTETTDTHPTEVSYFLPHHGVLRENSLSTKLRTVFDASAVTSSGKSLNNIQHIGPFLQDDIISILIRFRQHRVVVTADIEKMYRQTLVAQQFRSLQQIFWRSDPDQPLKKYKLNTVTYGTASAPYLATRCLIQLGRDSTDEQVKQTILSDMYVDDLVTGNNVESQLISTCKGVIRTLEGAHFHLRKWRSNKPSILTQIVDENTNDELLSLSKDKYAKTLGLLWACKSDELLFSSTNIDTKTNSNKRTILSTIAQVFDPLGLINPCMLQAKLILQTLWAKNISWDEELPPEIQSQWQQFIVNLPNLTKIQIPRHVLLDDYIKVEIHSFSDASIKSYSGCVYLRSLSSSGLVKVHLVLSKSRVAPLKQKLTIPRLELFGALLATQLADKVRKSLRVNLNSQFFYSDSTIVLSWIKSCKHNLRQFVYNRVKDILQTSEPSSWNYVPTDLNPADIGSRGLNATQLQASSLWWEGPHFLHDTEIKLPTQPHLIHTQGLPETKIHCHIQSSELQRFDFLDKYSSYSKLQRIVAYIKRFIYNCRNLSNKFIGKLTFPELHSSTLTLCKLVQRDIFHKQYSILTNKSTLPSKDKILKLNPFIDSSSELIRVGGRLSNSNYNYDTKYPILLHASHKVTQLLVEYYHKYLLHAGPQLVLSILRHKFWIVNGRNLVRKVTHNCIHCCRFAGKTYQPIMGNLPQARLEAEFPFTNTAIDYCGPILIADKKGRSCRLQKAYICVFVCLAVKAVHIELVTELSSHSFMSALNRFIARRGKPTNIYSDNGTNFVGACNEINRFIKSTCNDVTSYSSENGINFKFSPAYSPHFNGLAEASVKSIKFHLKRVLGMAHLNYEEMNTVLVQIESILNSRPLTPLSSDPSDLIPLTPAHFLIGRVLTTLPSPQVPENVPLTNFSRFTRIQALRDHFWKRFYREYVSELQTRSKWHTTKGQPCPGDMVVIKDDRLPPNRWLLGRVIAVHPGTDDVNRVADIRTTSGTLRRAFNRLCPLPTLELTVPRPGTC